MSATRTIGPALTFLQRWAGSQFSIVQAREALQHDAYLSRLERAEKALLLYALASELPLTAQMKYRLTIKQERANLEQRLRVLHAQRSADPEVDEEIERIGSLLKLLNGEGIDG
jgi:hypothetical protein